MNRWQDTNTSKRITTLIREVFVGTPHIAPPEVDEDRYLAAGIRASRRAADVLRTQTKRSRWQAVARCLRFKNSGVNGSKTSETIEIFFWEIP